MRCPRCGFAVPQWLWIGDDHPVIIEEQPIRIFRTDSIEDNTMKIVAESKVAVKMCKDVHISKNSDFIDIGPECFTDRSGYVISYKGENYYRSCSKLVTGSLDGEATHCVKRVLHPNDCEDYVGNTRESR